MKQAIHKTTLEPDILNAKLSVNTHSTDRLKQAVSTVIRRIDPYVLLSFLSPIAVLLLWAYASHQQWLPAQILVPPSTIWTALQDSIESGELQMHLHDSLFRLLIGFAIGTFSGMLFGIVFAVSKTFRAYFGLLFEILRQIPVLVLIPMFILFFGIGETLKILLLVKAVFFPIAIASIEAVGNIPRQYIELGQIYRLKPWAWFKHIIFPATLPPIISGIRISLGRAWLVLVAVELLAAGTGIGQMMELGRQMLRLDIVMIGVIITGLIGFILDKSLRLFEKSFSGWQRPITD